MRSTVCTEAWRKRSRCLRSNALRVVLLILSASVDTGGAQSAFPVYRDSFGITSFARPPVRAQWFENGRPERVASPINGELGMLGPFGTEQVDLRLAALPPHRAVRVSFVVLMPFDQETGVRGLQFCFGDGRRWHISSEEEAAPSSESTLSPIVYARASGQRAWLVERMFDHESSELRLRWSVPVTDASESWAITNLLIESISDLKTLDLSPRRQCAVIFAGTDGMPSHGFLIFERESALARRTEVAAYGFYPDPEISTARLVLLRSVPGVMHDELGEHKLTRVRNQLVVYTTASQFEAARAVVEHWRCNARYRLLTRDCVTLTREVSTALGLQVPARGPFRSLPADYLRELINAN